VCLRILKSLAACLWFFRSGEIGISWFFHTPGSGIFLNCSALPKSSSGTIVAFKTRLEVMAALGSWPAIEGGKGLTEFMDQHNMAMLVITDADYSIQRGPGLNPRTEIIVRQAQPAPVSDWYGGQSEEDQPHRSCLSDPPFGLASSFSTGLQGTRQCQCVPSDRLNCDASG
jgi:hypothetical protein